MPVIGNVHPIKIENVDIFCDVIFLRARVFIFLIDRGSHLIGMTSFGASFTCVTFLSGVY